MCRSIKVLRVANAPATRDEISAAALQFVRKVSGYRKPSRANEEVFNRAIVEISSSVTRLLGDLAPVPNTRSAAPKASDHQSPPAPPRSPAAASYENPRALKT
jgi:hypothetical protein